MSFNIQSCAEAAARALILFGPNGRTVDSYHPAEELLIGARAGGFDRSTYRPVQGPYLRKFHRCDPRTGTGVVGVSISRERATGRHFVRVRLGNTCRRFCIETLGRTEALRRAIVLRREHEKKIVQANDVILRARAQAGGAS